VNRTRRESHACRLFPTRSRPDRWPP
jgi:hypothetical protein